MFGVVFPDRSFPMDISNFAQIDPTHWILDMNTFVRNPFLSTLSKLQIVKFNLVSINQSILLCAGEAYDSIREVCIFLLNSLYLPPDKALAVYIQSPSSPFIYCGIVMVPEPGVQMQLTSPNAAPLSAKIGISVEDLAILPFLDVATQNRIEHLAMKVVENLINFMKSFGGLMVASFFLLK
ncbi:hypothetical protein CsSME_00006184 [Camellia sinensis var. sinensis]